MTTSPLTDGPAAPAAGPSGRPGWLSRRRSARRTAVLDAAEVDALCWAWRRACEGAGACHTVDTPTGPTVSTPHVLHVTLGPPTVLLVRLLPGMVAEDLRRVSYRLAGHVGAGALRITGVHREYARVELVHADPLAEALALPLHDLRGGPVLLGRDEGGELLAEDWHRTGHTIVQGVTRSGKSVWSYGLLAQLAADPCALVAGCDPTGLLLGRAWAGSRHAGWQCTGLADHQAHEDALARVVAEMDQRITALPIDRDTLAVTVTVPLLVVVLEEYPGLLRALDAEDPKRGKRVRALVGRLLAEGAKVGVRVVILAQRAEAAVVGAFERAMCSLRISFRTDNRATVELLHPGAPPDLADAHSSAPAGVALLSAPGRELTRIRGPLLGGDPERVYPAYVAAVRAAAGG